MGFIEDFIRKNAGEVGANDIKHALKNKEGIVKKLIGPLAKFAAKVRLFISMLSDYQAGKYRNPPVWTVCVVAFSLLYILMPLDLMPDFIPIAGLVDDALVMAAALLMIGKDIDDYEKWLAEGGYAKRDETKV